jgi:DNA-binding IclR family transcriptional regulator
MDIEKSTDNRNHKIYFVPGLSRGLRVLEVLAERQRPMTLSEIAHELEISRSSAYRLVYTLRYMGFLENPGDGREFALGPRVLNIGFAYLNSQDLVRTARTELEALRDVTGISTHLAIRDGRDVLFLDCIQSKTGFLSNVSIGARLPAHATPLGWLMLTDISNRDLAALYDGVTMVKLTDSTPKDLGALTMAIAEAASKGYVFSDGIVERGGRSIAAPVYSRSGMVVAAIDISGPSSAFDGLDKAKLIADVQRAARALSGRLGAQVK